MLNANDAIGEATIPLQRFFRTAFRAKAAATAPLQRSFPYEGDESSAADGPRSRSAGLTEALWRVASGERPKHPKEEGTKVWLPVSMGDEPRGWVQVSLELVPTELAKSRPAGHGRSEPNQGPTLQPPAGRVQLSLNPFTTLGQLLGPKLATQACTICCCVLCVALLGYLLFSSVPVVLGDAFESVLKVRGL